jgi:hypothetical protein
VQGFEDDVRVRWDTMRPCASGLRVTSKMWIWIALEDLVVDAVVGRPGLGVAVESVERDLSAASRLIRLCARSPHGRAATSSM